MAAYYDPMLFASTPGHPNSMGIMAILQEPVDGDMLRAAVEKVRVRFPYFYVRAEVSGNDLKAVPNPLPMTVRNTWQPTFLHSEEVNYHMAAFKYEGNALALEISHMLTDGSGVLPYFKSVLYCYLSDKTGEKFDPTGFRLPGDPIPDAEMGDPFQNLNLQDAPKPFYTKKTSGDCYDICNVLADKLHGTKNIYLKVPEARVMEICKQNDGSPNVLFAVLLAKAVRRMDPNSDKTVLIGVAINHKAILGNYENYHFFSNVIYLDFSKDRENESLDKMCTIARGQIMLQSQPENSMSYVKGMQNTSEMMSSIPLTIKSGMVDVAKAFSSRGTAGVSYTNSRSFGPLDPYIREVFVLAEADTFGVQIEIACINGSFCLMFAQRFLSEVYFEAFLKELEEAEIPVEIVRKDQCLLSGVRFDGIGNEKQDILKEILASIFPTE